MPRRKGRNPRYTPKSEKLVFTLKRPFALFDKPDGTSGGHFQRITFCPNLAKPFDDNVCKPQGSKVDYDGFDDWIKTTEFNRLATIATKVTFSFDMQNCSNYCLYAFSTNGDPTSQLNLNFLENLARTGRVLKMPLDYGIGHSTKTNLTLKYSAKSFHPELKEAGFFATYHNGLVTTTAGGVNYTKYFNEITKSATSTVQQYPTDGSRDYITLVLMPIFDATTASNFGTHVASGANTSAAGVWGQMYIETIAIAYNEDNNGPLNKADYTDGTTTDLYQPIVSNDAATGNATMGTIDDPTT